MITDTDPKENIDMESTTTNPHCIKQTPSETVSDKAIGFVILDRIHPTKQEMILLLKLRRIKWYGWNGRPENLTQVRDFFKMELRIWCSQHGTVLSDRELTDVVDTFYHVVGWS